MNTTMILLFLIIVFINIIEAYQCRLYIFTADGELQHGPYDVGQYTGLAGARATIYAEGYWCYATLTTFFSGPVISLTAAPFGSDTGTGSFINSAEVWSVATPSAAPTIAPSVAPSNSPTIPPTSSCLDYNNETSYDGNNEIREFNYKDIININNYYTNNNTVLEFNTSYDINYKNKLIECAVSDCIIQCHNTACLKTNIE
eukprot:547968_1